MSSPEVILPTPSALGKYNLTRFVASKSHDGNKQNPFIMVNEKPSVNSLGDDNNDRDFYMNEVVVEAFEYQPYRITSKTNNGMVQTTIDYGNAVRPPIIATYRILLDADKNVGVSYSHGWDQPDTSLLGSVYNKINEVTADLAINTTRVHNAMSRLGSEGPYKSEPIKRMDFQKIYTDSPFPTISVEFTAFTNDNFIGDIYVPIMSLCGFTHPKRFTGNDSAGAEDVGWWQSVLSSVSNAANGLESVAAYVSQEVNETLALSARQYTLKPPCLFNVYHQSGLYSYSNCMCTNIQITYEGPWYNATVDERQVFDILTQGQMKMDLKRKAFPTIARVRMDFDTGERLTRDDFTNIVSNFTQIANTGVTTYTKFGG